MLSARFLQFKMAFSTRLRKYSSVGMWEHGVTGFGDRLTGIAYLLYLANAYNTKTLYYHDMRCHPWHSPSSREEVFRGSMCELLDIEGHTFRPSPLPMPRDVYYVEHDSGAGNKFVQLGFPFMHLLRPRQKAVIERLATLELDNKNAIGLHIRRTDMVGFSRYEKENGSQIVSKALDNLDRIAAAKGLRRVFLATDNAKSQIEWKELLHGKGYEVITSDCQYDSTRWRQTSAEDMLVDFFALSRCVRIVRLVPSNFSLYAAWVGGHFYKYDQLC